MVPSGHVELVAALTFEARKYRSSGDASNLVDGNNFWKTAVRIFSDFHDAAEMDDNELLHNLMGPLELTGCTSWVAYCRMGDRCLNTVT
jgi:hypothetical protein